ncbi:MAG TPA: hypothetical protein EYP79_00595 [Campylobacterales bacterium]|nr:hypothetical protein [Campylobacterales bacterium]
MAQHQVNYAASGGLPVAYLHKTECIADRMFVRAVSAALESGEINSERFYRFDDYETMSLFRSLQGYTGDIFKRLYRRQLFKSLWRGKTDTISRDMVNRLISLRKKPQRHIEFENYLADYFNIPHGYLLFDIQMAPSVDIRDSPRIIPEIYISEHGDIKRIDEISRLAESLSDAIWDHWFCALYTAPEYRKILSDKIIDMPEIIEDGLP